MISAFSPYSDRWGHLGESPVFDPNGMCLWWADTEGCQILRTALTSGATTTFKAPEAVGCIGMWSGGKLLAGLASGMFLFDPDSGTFDLACSPETRQDVRFNDGALDPAGRFFAGTMHRDITEPAGAIFCVERDLSHRRLFEGLWTPNGLAFDPVRARMYFSDSHPSVRTIWVCDYDVLTGTPSNRRVFATTHAVEGRPDGAFVDAEGIYWIAGVGGSQILRFTPGGEMLAPITVPISHPTKLLMVDGSLYLTSRRTARPEEEHPSGHLLRASIS